MAGTKLYSIQSMSCTRIPDGIRLCKIPTQATPSYHLHLLQTYCCTISFSPLWWSRWHLLGEISNKLQGFRRAPHLSVFPRTTVDRQWMVLVACCMWFVRLHSQPVSDMCDRFILRFTFCFCLHFPRRVDCLLSPVTYCCVDYNHLVLYHALPGYTTCFSQVLSFCRFLPIALHLFFWRLVAFLVSYIEYVFGWWFG